MSIRSVETYLATRWEYLGKCWEHARNHRVVAVVTFLVVAYGIITNWRPVIQLGNWADTAKWPKLPLPWALLIVALGLVFIVVEGSYRLQAGLQARLQPTLVVQDLYITPSPTQSAGQCVYIQVQVACATEAPLDNCQGHLTKVRRWPSEEKGWITTQLDERLQLGWSLEQSHSIHLDPKVGRRLNIFWILESKDRFFICTPDGSEPLRAQGVFNKTDVFRFDVVLTSDSSVSIPVCLEAKWGKKWDKPLLAIVDDASAPPVVYVPNSESR